MPDSFWNEGLVKMLGTSLLKKKKGNSTQKERKKRKRRVQRKKHKSEIKKDYVCDNLKINVIIKISLI